MPRYIDADALKEALRNLTRWIVKNGDKHNEGFTYDQVFFCIDARPTADVVERKRGKWIDYPIVEGCLQCSVCGILRLGESNYCPNCGADMRGEDDA